MSFRDFINRQSRLVGSLIVVGAILAIAISVHSTRSSAPSGPITQGYFSDDDGKTWFADDIGKAFPFDHNGHQAYRAYLFHCGSGAPFVGYLGSSADTQSNKPQNAAPTRSEQFGQQRVAGMQVKKPGDKKWVPLNSPEGAAISNVTCPNGERAEAALPSQ